MEGVPYPAALRVTAAVSAGRSKGGAAEPGSEPLSDEASSNGGEE